MAHETVVLLRSLLYQAKSAKDVDEIIRAIEVMCTKDDIAAVEQQIVKAKEKLEAQNKSSNL